MGVGTGVEGAASAPGSAADRVSSIHAASERRIPTWCTPTNKSRIETLRFGAGRQREVLERMDKAQTFRAARVHVRTGYSPVEGNRRASRNGLVSDHPPGIPTSSL
jgi:hypothetical protein